MINTAIDYYKKAYGLIDDWLCMKRINKKIIEALESLGPSESVLNIYKLNQQCLEKKIENLKEKPKVFKDFKIPYDD